MEPLKYSQEMTQIQSSSDTLPVQPLAALTASRTKFVIFPDPHSALRLQLG